jgi:hypothetical protein
MNEIRLWQHGLADSRFGRSVAAEEGRHLPDVGLAPQALAQELGGSPTVFASRPTGLALIQAVQFRTGKPTLLAQDIVHHLAGIFASLNLEFPLMEIASEFFVGAHDIRFCRG